MTRHHILLAALVALAAPAHAAEAAAGSKSCIGNREIKQSRQSSDAGYFVRTSAGWWRNSASCPALAQGRSIVTRSYNDRQCRGDVIDVFDPFSRITYGSCALGSWDKVAGPPPKEK